MKDAEEDFESLNQLTDCILKKERYIKRATHMKEMCQPKLIMSQKYSNISTTTMLVFEF